MDELKDLYYEVLDFMDEHELSFREVCTLMEIKAQFVIADAIRDGLTTNIDAVIDRDSIRDTIKSFEA